MSKIRFYFLVIVTIALVVIAWLVTQQRTPETEVQKAALYPGLIDKLNDITQIEIKSADQYTTLAKYDDAWLVKNRDGFPALFTKVQELAFGISELAVLEPKTNVPERYARLGVEDIDSEDAKSKLITLKDKDGSEVASLIVGKERVSKGGPPMRAHYVRRAGEEQSFLVEGNIDTGSEPTEWLDKELFDISSDRIRSIEIKHADGDTVSISRENADQTDFVLGAIKKGHKLRSQTTLSGMASALNRLNFQDVMAKGKIDLSKDPITTTFKSFDGLVTTATSVTNDDKTYTRFEFTYDPSLVTSQDDSSDDKNDNSSEETDKETEQASDKDKKQPSVEEEVETLNKMVANWAYQLPSYQQKKFTSRMDDLISPEEEKEKEAKPVAIPNLPR